MATYRVGRWGSIGLSHRPGACKPPTGSSGSTRLDPSQVVRFWADADLIHLLIGGTRIKTLFWEAKPATLGPDGRPSGQGESGLTIAGPRRLTMFATGIVGICGR
jgi:hypothetical protein